MYRLFLSCLFVIGIFTLQVSAEEVKKKTHKVLQFDNDYVTVWKTVIMPDQPLKMHRHDCSRVIVTLKGGTLLRIEETGETSELVFEDGKSYWLPEDPPGTLHGDINISQEPVEVVVIEVKSNDYK